MIDPRVQSTIAHIENNFDQELTPDLLAKAVNLSTSRLCHLFKSETNMGPLQYLRTVRMQRAKQLLETTFLSVKQIMIEVGLKDESHFIRDFKVIYGLPPAKFRTQFLLKRSSENPNGAPRQNRPQDSSIG